MWSTCALLSLTRTGTADNGKMPFSRSEPKRPSASSVASSSLATIQASSGRRTRKEPGKPRKRGCGDSRSRTSRLKTKSQSSKLVKREPPPTRSSLILSLQQIKPLRKKTRLWLTSRRTLTKLNKSLNPSKQFAKSLSRRGKEWRLWKALQLNSSRPRLSRILPPKRPANL